MRQVTITSGEAGQRFDKYLRKYLKEAPDSFLYKMLRKKNITLNSGKASGGERLQAGDVVCLYLSEETLAGFGAGASMPADKDRHLTEESWAAYRKFGKLQVVYEDEHILAVNKPAGILSQKAALHDLSLNEWLTGYLLATKKITEESLRTFHPSVCNRLDRNTSGIVICGKSLCGSQEMSRVFRDRSLHKYYLLYVEGHMCQGQTIEGYLCKDRRSNRVEILPVARPGCAKIVTSYRPVHAGQEETLVEVELITGKTHQIRAHLASEGFPLTGDPKYGNPLLNEKRKREYGITHQLLHAYRVVFPRFTGALEALSGREIRAPLPAVFRRLGGSLPAEYG